MFLSALPSHQFSFKVLWILILQYCFISTQNYYKFSLASFASIFLVAIFYMKRLKILNCHSNQTDVGANHGKARESDLFKFKLNVIFYILPMVTDT